MAISRDLNACFIKKFTYNAEIPSIVPNMGIYSRKESFSAKGVQVMSWNRLAMVQ